MVKIILLSVLAATVTVPALAARDRSPRRGLWRALLLLLFFDVVYLALLRFVYVPYLPPEMW